MDPGAAQRHPESGPAPRTTSAVQSHLETTVAEVQSASAGVSLGSGVDTLSTALHPLPDRIQLPQRDHNLTTRRGSVPFTKQAHQNRITQPQLRSNIPVNVQDIQTSQQALKSQNQIRMGTQVFSTVPSAFPQDPIQIRPDIYTSDFGNLAAGQIPFYYNDPANQQQHLISPQMLATDLDVQRALSQSPTSQVRLSNYNQRTPIRHHRPPVSRTRSRSRSEALMAYAGRQTQIPLQSPRPSIALVPSQSAPTTPQTYPVASYQMTEPISSFTGNVGYFPQSASAQPQSSFSDFGMFHDEQHFMTYGPSGRTSPHEMVSSRREVEGEEGLYMHRQQQSPLQKFLSTKSTQQTFPPIQKPLESSPGDLEVSTPRPKPQCWDHGCNGRQFSTFSNLLRHQREKSGSATKAICPHCGTEFTRTTARNGHMYGGKCKGRPEQDATNQNPEESEDQDQEQKQQNFG